MKYYLSADGGGTKTAFLLCDENGNRAAETMCGPSNFMVVGLDSAAICLNKGITELKMISGITEDEIQAGFIALAGYGDVQDPSYQKGICTTLRKKTGMKQLYFGNDTENAMEGSLLGKPGIHLISGTGSIALGKDLDGKMHRCGGWHHLFGGDEGSAYWIACRYLDHFTKQADHREKETGLVPYFLQAHDLREPSEMLKLILDDWKGKRENIAMLAIEETELAEQGDPCAIGIIEEAAQELALIVHGVLVQGRFPEPCPVSYSGGVFHAEKQILQPLQKALAEERAVLEEPVLDPLAGGILLAMKQDGAAVSEDVIRNLKETVFNNIV